MSAQIDEGASSIVGKRQELFEWNSDGLHPYDVHPDGRFLVVQVEPEHIPDRLHVVLNWFDELERLVPTKWSDLLSDSVLLINLLTDHNSSPGTVRFSSWAQF